MKGAPRWRQAQSDDDPSPFKAFASVLGPKFIRTAAPKTSALLDALTADMGSVIGPAKQAFGRQRPPLVDRSLQTCAPLEQTKGYPSGAGSLGWLTALVLSRMVPEKANAILDRGRDDGDSRAVCAEHFPSHVQAGRLVGAAVFATAEADPGFERDFQAAKDEPRAAIGL